VESPFDDSDIRSASICTDLEPQTPFGGDFICGERSEPRPHIDNKPEFSVYVVQVDRVLLLTCVLAKLGGVLVLLLRVHLWGAQSKQSNRMVEQ
jgi:hypothetical protein